MGQSCVRIRSHIRSHIRNLNSYGLFLEHARDFRNFIGYGLFMKRNSRLSLALHALGHMAADPERPLTSNEIAEHNQTNPVYVRRVLGLLRQAGLLTSATGPRGGWLLARPADAISLADVYLALGERFMRPEPVGDDNPPQCLVERELRTELDAALEAAEATLTDRLSRVSIARLGAALRN